LGTGNTILSQPGRFSGGAKPLERQDTLFPENEPLQELLMGVETPIPPKMMNTAAPAGRPRGGSGRLKLLFADFDASVWTPVHVRFYRANLLEIRERTLFSG
jgi:hypothetical protein